MTPAVDLPRAAARDWQTAPVAELVHHILETHHAYLKRDLPVLQARIGTLLAAPGACDQQNLPRLATVFAGLRDELELHLHKEEVILFPYIEQCGRAEQQHLPGPRSPFGSVAHPIAMMEREHGGAADALAAIRALTNNFTPAPGGPEIVQELYDGLRALEEDLLTHIHLENDILFPRAVAAEWKLAQSLNTGA